MVRQERQVLQVQQVRLDRKALPALQVREQVSHSLQFRLEIPTAHSVELSSQHKMELRITHVTEMAAEVAEVAEVVSTASMLLHQSSELQTVMATVY
jgi:hypothetical protein